MSDLTLKINTAIDLILEDKFSKGEPVLYPDLIGSLEIIKAERLLELQAKAYSLEPEVKH